jgi:hypothetical protein
VTTEILAGGVAPVSGVAAAELLEEEPPPPPPLHPANESASITPNVTEVALVKNTFCGDFISVPSSIFLGESTVTLPAIYLCIESFKPLFVNMPFELDRTAYCSVNYS